MVRLALAYLAVAMLAILMVTGLPFGGATGLKTDLAAQGLDVGDTGMWSGLSAWFQDFTPTGESVAELPTPSAAEVTTATDLASTAAPITDASSREISLETLLASAIAAGQTPAQIDQLVNAAVGRGSVRVPAMLITTEGRVDTAVLMAAARGPGLGAPKEQGDSSSDESFVTPETAILDIQDMTYLVQPGDSLGALAMKFYGNPQLFHQIFDANRTVLATPGSLRAGQSLLIPSRSKL